MSATTPDVPRHARTDRGVFRSGGESGRVSRAERRGEHRGHEARRACADASEKPDRPWHRTTSSSRIITLRIRRVKAFLSLGEFAHDATAGIFNDYVALQVWAGTPDKTYIDPSWPNQNSVEYNFYQDAGHSDSADFVRLGAKLYLDILCVGDML